MAEKETQQRGITIPGFAGLNERAAISNIPEGYFEKLEGLYPARTGLLERIPGKTFLRQIGSPVIAIHQCFDTNDNILIQTEDDVQVFTLDQILGRTTTSNLIPTPIEEEETMAYALLVHQASTGTSAGPAVTAATGAGAYTVRQLTNIINSGTNPDGTPFGTSGFVTLTSNRFTLPSGVYRIRIKSCFANTATASSACVFTGSIANTGTLTVTSVASGTIQLGQILTGTNVPSGTIVTGFGTGTGATGTYLVSCIKVVASTAITGNGNSYQNQGYKFILWNTTANTNAFAGNFQSSGNVQISSESPNINVWSDLQNQITIATQTTFEIRDKNIPSSGTIVPANYRGLANGAGTGTANTENEIYTIVEILKTN
jgi:hypothetical protein